jgi:GAF domain-containing protein
MTGSTASRSVSHRVDRLCVTCVRDAHVDGGAVALMSANGVRDLLCATDPVAEQLERLQIELGEGPAVAAGGTLAPILVEELAHDGDKTETRWPFFTARAHDLGVRSLFAFPIRVNDVSVGTLALHRRTPGPLGTSDLGYALTTVEQIGEVFLDPSSESSLDEMPSAQVHQAAGMVMIQLNVAIGEALALLRATAFAENIALTKLAGDVVNRRRRLEEGTVS